MVRGGPDVRFHEDSTRVPPGFHQGSTRVPRGFHKVMRGLRGGASTKKSTACRWGYHLGLFFWVGGSGWANLMLCHLASSSLAPKNPCYLGGRTFLVVFVLFGGVYMPYLLIPFAMSQQVSLFRTLHSKHSRGKRRSQHPGDMNKTGWMGFEPSHDQTTCGHNNGPWRTYGIRHLPPSIFPKRTPQAVGGTCPPSSGNVILQPAAYLPWNWFVAGGDWQSNSFAL